MYCDLSLLLAQCFPTWYGLHLPDFRTLGTDYGIRPQGRLGIGSGSPLGMVIWQVAHVENMETRRRLMDRI